MYAPQNEREPQLAGLVVLERLATNAWRAIDEQDTAGARPLAIKATRANHTHPTKTDVAEELEHIAAVHAYAKCALGHSAPTVVEALDIRSTSNATYLCTRFVEPHEATMEDCSTYDILCAGVSMLDTLGLVHRAGIRHNDAKDQNWIIPKHDLHAPVLIDFSVATNKARRPDWVPLGTIPFSSPQQLLRQPDPRADVYAVGVLLYSLLTGEHPVPIPTHEETMPLHEQYDRHIRRLKTQMPTWDGLLERHPDLDIDAYYTIDRMIAYASDARPSLLDARNALAATIGLPEKRPLPRL